MRRTYRAAAAAALLSASAAWAVAKGSSLYIKSIDVQLPVFAIAALIYVI